MPLVSLLSQLSKPYLQLVTDYLEKPEANLTYKTSTTSNVRSSVTSGSIDDEYRRRQKARYDKFETLSQHVKNEHYERHHSSNSICDNTKTAADGDSTVRFRTRRQSETDVDFVDSNSGFCAEVSGEDNSAGAFSWFETDWQLKHVGGSNESRIHCYVDSLFSSASGFNNFRGLLNLGIILLVVSNARVALENLLKYGVLVDPGAILSGFYNHLDSLYPCFNLLLLCNVFILVSLVSEWVIELDRVPIKLMYFIQIVNLLAVLTIPAVIVLYLHPNPFFSSPTLGMISVLFLKLWSFRDVNSWCRYARILAKNKHFERKRNKSIASAMSELNQNDKQKSKQNDKQQQSPMIHYPDNLTFSSLYYFIFAPTLCYELNYPLLLKIRKRFLAKRAIELIFLPQVMAALAQQWIVPILQNSVRPFKQSEWPVVLERLMKLAIPNHLIWLIFFYVFFHSALNVFGELLRFADRTFYKDWWNSESVTDFWSTWNIPVHRFAKRHIYLPLILRWKLNKMHASVVVFVVSAFFHEYLVSIPLQMFRLWAFSGMLVQVPFAIFVGKVLKGGQPANMAVWFSLIIGQPLAMIMYFHDYYVQLQTAANVTMTT